LMHCSAFAVFLGEGAKERLQKSLPRVDRHRRRVLASNDGADFGELSELREADLAIALLFLDGEGGLPAVHGPLFDGRENPSGEFSFLDVVDGSILAGRDLLGTRPLYVSQDGKSLASDHRFLSSSQEGRLLPPGTSYRASDAYVKTRCLGRVHPPDSEASAASELAIIIESSVKRRVEGERRVAVSFSGGLDSSIVAFCAAKHSDVILCSAYSDGSRDEKQSELIADKLGLPMVSRALTPQDIRRELKVLDLPFEPTPMDQALWCIFSTTSRLARENGAETILLGQLADELFGGYVKYVRAMEEGGVLAAERMMKEDLARCGEVGLVRDELVCSASVEPRFPFADEGVASMAVSVPFDFKIRGGRRKHVLREAAKLLGLPEAVVETPKKAAQYSSGILKLLP
jgi:asparagine synthase (glutamine-hydrolysing)